MKATIWHNPRCSKSRAALALLEEAGAEVEIIEYLRTPPTRDQLVDLLARAGLLPRDGLRRVEGRHLQDSSDEAVLDAMAADPSLIERPLVATEKGVRLGRPTERIAEIL